MSAHGRELQEEILKIARSSGMRIWGPNCMGLVNPVDGVALSSTASLAGSDPSFDALCRQHGIIGESRSVNPADLAISDMDIYRACVESIASDPRVDAILYAFGTTPEWEKRMGSLIEYGKQASVPLFFYTLVGSKAGVVPEMARDAGIPFFRNLDLCLTAIRDCYRYGELRGKRLREIETK